MEETAHERLQKRLMTLWGQLSDDEKELLLTVLALADEAQAEVSGLAMDVSAVSLLGADVKSKFDAATAQRKAGENPVEYLKFDFKQVFLSS